MFMPFIVALPLLSQATPQVTANYPGAKNLQASVSLVHPLPVSQDALQNEIWDWRIYFNKTK